MVEIVNFCVSKYLYLSSRGMDKYGARCYTCTFDFWDVPPLKSNFGLNSRNLELLNHPSNGS